MFFILEHYIDEQALSKFAEDLRATGSDEWYISEILKCAIEDCKQYARQRKPMPWDEEMEKGKGRNERGAGRKKKDFDYAEYVQRKEMGEDNEHIAFMMDISVATLYRRLAEERKKRGQEELLG